MSRKLKESSKKIVAASQEWLCKHCGVLLPSSYEVDHIIPYSISKNDDISNLVALCSTCHSKKSQKEHNRILEYKKLLQYIAPQHTLCWACFQTFNNTATHSCDTFYMLNELKNVKKNQENVKKFDMLCYKYENINLNDDNILKKQRTKLGRCLKVIVTTETFIIRQQQLFSTVCIINYNVKYNLRSDRYTEITKAICSYVKQFPYKYSEIEITLEEYSEGEEKNLLVSLIERAMPEYIWDDPALPYYTFICKK